MAAERATERKKLKMRRITVTQEEIEKSKEFVSAEEDCSVIIMIPQDDFDEVDSRCVLFLCIDRESNKVK